MSRKDNGNEDFLRRSLPVYINSFNQLTYLRDTVNWFSDNGFQNIKVFDNVSSYPPLLDYFNSDDFNSKASLERLKRNIGPRNTLQMVTHQNKCGHPFIFTDPDLLLPTSPDPLMVTTMFEIGRKYKVLKVGLAIDISEPHLFKDESAYRTDPPQVWEQFAWEKELENGVYDAAVDTTFFLYTADQSIRPLFSDYALRQSKVPAIRIAKEGFITKHRPWYKECGQTAEEKEFYKSTAKKHASWLLKSY